MLAAAQASAQSGPTLSEFFHPDRLALYAVQTGVSLLRSQFALRYEGLSIDVMGGRLTMSGIEARPQMPWPDGGGCEIRLERLSLVGSPWDAVDMSRFRIDVNGLTAPLACVPQEARIGFATAGLLEIDVPQMTVDAAFDAASGAAVLNVAADVEDFATVTVDADFAYLAPDVAMGDAGAPPTFDAELSSARLTIEDQGVWNVLASRLPAPMTSPQSGGPTVGTALGGAVAGLVGEGQVMDRRTVDALDALIVSASDAWTAFLRSPQQLVVETSFPPDEPVRLDIQRYGGDPTAILADLRPLMSTAPRASRALLPASLFAAALANGAEGLPEEDRRDAGLALLTGRGAPMDIELGLSLLEPLARAGDAEAAYEIAKATQEMAPEAAYAKALVAAAAGQPGAVALLDAIEDGLPRSAVLELQSANRPGAGFTLPERVTAGALRQLALASLSGKDRQGRSYERALFWAKLGEAAGDITSAGIVRQIDDMARLSDPGDAEAWSDQRSRISRRALEFWVTNDLPARLAGSD